MKNTVAILVTILTHALLRNVCAQSDTSNVIMSSECANVEEFDATFEGGSDRFRDWVNSELKHLETASSINKLSATIIFVVNTDGSISDVEILNLNHPEISEQLTDIITRSPKWKPKGISVNGVTKYYKQRFKLPLRIDFL